METISKTNNTIMYGLPNQRVSEAEKRKPEHYIPTMNYYIDKAIGSNDKSDIQAWQAATAGVIDMSDNRYKYVLDPYGFKDQKLKNMPGNLQNHDIINPIVDRYVGEHIKSTGKFTVVCNNSDSLNKKKEEKQKGANGLYKQLFINGLNAGGIQSGVPSKEVQQPQVYSAKFEAKWDDARAIFGQEALNYILAKTDGELKGYELYRDWVVNSEMVTFREVYRDQIYKEVINPIEYYSLSNGSDFYEDDDGGVRKFKMSISQINSRFRDKLTNTDRDYLDYICDQQVSNEASVFLEPTTMLSHLTGRPYYDMLLERYSSSTGKTMWGDVNKMVDVYHLVIKREYQIKILKYYNKLGEEKEMEVSTSYTLDKENGDIEVRNEWIERVYSGYRIGDEYTGIYTELEVMEVQRDETNNSASVKLPYNGKKNLFKYSANHSVVRKLIPYQIVTNIFHLQRERAISRNKGKILIMPEGLMTEGSEISQEQKVYFIGADGILYVNDAADNFAQSLSALKSVDMSDAEYIFGMGRLIEEVKTEAWEAVSMNRQRMGETYASDGKGNNEQAIVRASIGSAPINEIFNKFLEKDYLADLDHSKYAWVEQDGTMPLGSFVNSDDRRVYFIVNGKEHLESDYGLQVKNAAKEKEKIEAYKNLAFSASQNGQFDIAAEAIDGGNTSKLKGIINKATQLAAKTEQERNDAIQNAEKMKQEAETARQQGEQAFIRENLLIEEEGKNARAVLESNTKIAISNSNTLDGNAPAPTTDVQSNINAINQIDIKNKELDLKAKEIASKENIAVVNKNQYDKPKN